MIPLVRTRRKVIDVRGRNPGYSISYYSTSDNQTDEPRDSYQWLQVPGQCSSECGGGVQIGNLILLNANLTSVFNYTNSKYCKVTYQCFSRNKNRQVSPRLCGSKLISTPSFRKSCNNDNCPARWELSDWSDCSVSCGGGISTRNITCRQKKIIGDVCYK